MMECTGDGCEGNGCIVWSIVWLLDSIPRNFLARPFLCRFGAHAKISERSSQAVATVLEGQANFKADAIQQYGRRDNVRIVGLDDGGCNEDPCDEVINVAGLSGESFEREDIKVCHRLLFRNGDKRPLIAGFVRREKKIKLMRNKKNKQSQSAKIYLIDDVTSLRLRIPFFAQRSNHQICPSVNEMIIAYKELDWKTVINTLYDVQRVFPKIVESAFNQAKKLSQLGILLFFSKNLSY